MNINFLISTLTVCLTTIYIVWVRDLVQDFPILILAKLVGFVLGIFAVSHFFGKKIGINYGLLAGLVSLFISACLGFLNIPFLGIVISSIGFLFFLSQIKIPSKKNIWLLLLFTLFIFNILHTIYYEGTISLFIIEELQLESTNRDILFHLSLINSIRNYHLPAIPLDGIEFLKYHYLVHFLFAGWSKLFSTSSVSIYSYSSGIVLFPLFIYYFIQTCISIKQCLFGIKKEEEFVNHLYIVFFIFWVGITPLELQYKIKTGFFNSLILTSFSYVLGGILLFTFVSFLVQTIYKNKQYWWEYFLLSIFSMLAKVSLLVIVAPSLLIYYLLIRDRKKIILAFLLNITAGAFYLYALSSSLPIALNFLDSAKYATDKGFFIYHIFAALFPCWIVIYFLLKNMDKEKKHLNMLIVLLAMMCFAYLPTALLNMEHNGAYFFDYVKYIGLLFLVVFITESYQRWKDFFMSHISRKYILALLLFYIFSNYIVSTLRNAYTLIKKDKQMEYIWTQNQDKIKKQPHSLLAQRNAFITHLSNLAQKEYGSNTLAFISQKDTLLYDIVVGTGTFSDNKFSIPMIIPAISGLALIDGLPPYKYMSEQFYFFGYDSYQVRKSENDYQTEQSLCKYLKNKQLEGKKILFISTDTIKTHFLKPCK